MILSQGYVIVNGCNATSYISTIPNRYVCIDYISGRSLGAGLRILPYPTQSPAFLISQKTAPKSRFLPASPRGKRFCANFHIPCKKSPGSEEPGDSFQIVSSQYAERIIATSRARPMALFNHQTIRTNWLSALLTYSWGPAATRALPSSLPVYFSKFLMKRADRSLAFSSQMEASA